MFPYAQFQFSLPLSTSQPTCLCTIPSGKIISVARETYLPGNKYIKPEEWLEQGAITFLYFLLRNAWVYFFQQDASVCSAGPLCQPGMRALVPFSSSLFSQQLERGCCFWGPPFSLSLSLCQDAGSVLKALKVCG